MDTIEKDPQSLTLIKLKPQRILNRPKRTKRAVRAIKIIGKTIPLASNRLIRGEFGLRIAEIAAISQASNRHQMWVTQQTQIMISLINHRALLALKTLEADKGKTGGAAVKRRMKAITAFKSARSDYNFLLGAARGAIGSTMGLRRQIQDTIDDEVKYLYFRGFEQPYESKSYMEDITTIQTTLNNDISYALTIYHYLRVQFDHFNELISQYNSALVASEK